MHACLLDLHIIKHCASCLNTRSKIEHTQTQTCTHKYPAAHHCISSLLGEHLNLSGKAQRGIFHDCHTTKAKPGIAVALPEDTICCRLSWFGEILLSALCIHQLVLLGATWCLQHAESPNVSMPCNCACIKHLLMALHQSAGSFMLAACSEHRLCLLAYALAWDRNTDQRA